MTKPCPLYLTPADVLAAFSGDPDRPAELLPQARQPSPGSFARLRFILSRPLRRVQRMFATAGGRAQSQTQPGGRETRGDHARPIAAAAQLPTLPGLLSHFATMQTGR